MIKRFTVGKEKDKKEVIAVGTHHNAESTYKEVKDTILNEKPDEVHVEMCEEAIDAVQKTQSWEGMNLWVLHKTKQFFLLWYKIFYTFYEEWNNLNKKIDVSAVDEELLAIEIGEKVGAKIKFIDRDIKISFNRFWNSQVGWNIFKSFWFKFKVFYSFLIHFLFLHRGEKRGIVLILLKRYCPYRSNRPMTPDELNFAGTIISYFYGFLNDVLLRVFFDERNRFMAEAVRNSKAKKIVLVCGALHVKEIIKYLKDRPMSRTEYDELLTVPQKSIWVNRTYGGGLVLLFSLLAYINRHNLLDLSILNNGWTAAGVVAATSILTVGLVVHFGARPLHRTTATAALTGPLAILPIFGSWFFAFIVQFFSRMPQVKDFEKLPRDTIIKPNWSDNRLLVIAKTIAFSGLGVVVSYGTTFIVITIYGWF